MNSLLLNLRILLLLLLPFQSKNREEDLSNCQFNLTYYALLCILYQQSMITSVTLAGRVGMEGLVSKIPRFRDTDVTVDRDTVENIATKVR